MKRQRDDVLYNHTPTCKIRRVEDSPERDEFKTVFNSQIVAVNSKLNGRSLITLYNIIIPAYSHIFTTVSKMIADTTFDESIIPKKFCIFYFLCDDGTYKKNILPKIKIPKHIYLSEDVQYYEEIVNRFELSHTREPYITFKKQRDQTLCLGVCDVSDINKNNALEITEYIREKMYEEYNVMFEYINPLSISYANPKDNIGNYDISEDCDYSQYYTYYNNNNPEQYANDPITKMISNFQLISETVDQSLFVLRVNTKPNNRMLTLKTIVFKMDDTFELLGELTSRFETATNGFGQQYCNVIILGMVTQLLFKQKFVNINANVSTPCSYYDMIGYNICEPFTLNIEPVNACKNVIYNQSSDLSSFVNLHDKTPPFLKSCKSIDLLDFLILTKLRESYKFMLLKYEDLDQNDYKDKVFSALIWLLNLKWLRRQAHKSDESWSKDNYAVFD